MDLVLDRAGGSGLAMAFGILAPLGLVVLVGSLDGATRGLVGHAKTCPPQSGDAGLQHAHFNDDQEPRRAATETLSRMLAEA